MEKKIVLVAGGTGLIGSKLVQALQDQGHEVRVLSRRKNTENSIGLFHWLPEIGKIDQEAIEGVQVIINLAGASVAGQRWTQKRKNSIISSRTESAQLLANMAALMPDLEHYISASGINAYGYNTGEQQYVESDPFGEDFLAQVVEKWEAGADLFKPHCKVSKLRIGVVFSSEGGAFQRIAWPVKFFVGAPLGHGQQIIPWVDMDDLVHAFLFVQNKGIDGVFNCINGNVSNEALTKKIAQVAKRPLILPNVPALILRLALGEMSALVLKGLAASNQKLLSEGFEFKENLESSIKKAL